MAFAGKSAPGEAAHLANRTANVNWTEKSSNDWPHAVLIFAARRAASQQFEQRHFQSAGCERKNPRRVIGAGSSEAQPEMAPPAERPYDNVQGGLEFRGRRRYRRVAGLLGLFRSLRLLGSYF